MTAAPKRDYDTRIRNTNAAIPPAWKLWDRGAEEVAALKNTIGPAAEAVNPPDVDQPEAEAQTGACVVQFGFLGIRRKSLDMLLRNAGMRVRQKQFSYSSLLSPSQPNHGTLSLADRPFFQDPISAQILTNDVMAMFDDCRRSLAVPAKARLPVHEQLHRNLLRAIDLAVDHDLLDVLFLTANMRKSEITKNTLGNLERSLNPMLAGKPFIWAGVHVPGSDDDPAAPQHHLHVVLFLPSRSRPVIANLPASIKLDGNSRWEWDLWMQPELRAWRKRRNRLMRKSALVKPIYDLAGLQGYFAGTGNLGVEGATPIAAKLVKSRRVPPTHSSTDAPAEPPGGFW